jgi:(p)ppGpp synthase/HD superfamily hydrolase
MNEKLELDLCSVKIKGESGMVDAVVSFYVNNVEQLDKVIGELRKMKLVNKVTRLERNIES